MNLHMAVALLAAINGGLCVQAGMWNAVLGWTVAVVYAGMVGIRRPQ